ncbi:MAG TPA: isochorismatase family cysteine hydrolase [Terracidiphilus sp.]|jgi:nicotinamidase-related amidase
MPDLTHAALLSMDFHQSIVSIYTQGDDGLMDRAGGVMLAARDVSMPVIHVQVGFREGLPEISERNVLFSAVKTNPDWLRLFTGKSGKLHASVVPEGDEVVITKHRGGAFAGTDLEMILRANGIDTLVLMGIATSGVVLATLLHAADADYRLVVIRDCCADREPEVHAALMDKLFPKMAAVVDAATMVEAIQQR